MKTLIATAIAVAGSTAAAQVDGANFNAEYGSSLWAQNVGTQFGNNTNPDIYNAGGSEIDAVYASISGGILRVGVAGNLETNFNKLNIALDFRAGGDNTLGFSAGLGALSGLTFDANFFADAVLSYTAGAAGGTGSGDFEHYLDGANIGVSEGFLGGGTRAALGGSGSINTSLDGAAIEIDQNNTNVLGVGGFGDMFDSDPALVDTGIEFSIDLAALGYDGSQQVLIAGWVNGSGNDFLSNQVIGGLPDGTGNLGGPSGVNFAAIDGLQYVSIPTPASAGLLGLGGLVAARRRR